MWGAHFSTSNPLIDQLESNFSKFYGFRGGRSVKKAEFQWDLLEDLWEQRFDGITLSRESNLSTIDEGLPFNTPFSNRWPMRASKMPGKIQLNFSQSVQQNSPQKILSTY